MNIIDNFFAKINNLPMLPKVVQEVMQLLSVEEIDVKAVVSKINLDQVLAAQVLRMANSAYFGCSRTIKTIDDAVAIIGLQKLHTLVVASGVTASFKDVLGLDLKRFWQHSLITASVARQLAAELKMDANTSYIAALMHSVGQLPIHMVFPAAGAQIEEVCRGRGVLERKTVEHTILGINHCQIGETLAKLWNFPEEILRVIRYYVEPLNPEACPLAPVVNASVHIAFNLEQGKEAKDIAETLNPDVLNVLGLSDLENLTEKIESYRGFVHEAKAYV